MADNRKMPGTNANDMLSRIDSKQLQNVMQGSPSQGTPIFTVEDLRTTVRPLAQLVRLFMIREGITKEKFAMFHRSMAMRTYMSTNNINYDRNNMSRAMTCQDVTWGFLEKLLGICNFDLVDVTLTLSNRETGEVSTISKSDVQELIKDNPYHPSIVIERVEKVTE